MQRCKLYFQQALSLSIILIKLLTMFWKDLKKNLIMNNHNDRFDNQMHDEGFHIHKGASS